MKVATPGERLCDDARADRLSTTEQVGLPQHGNSLLARSEIRQYRITTSVFADGAGTVKTSDLWLASNFQSVTGCALTETSRGAANIVADSSILCHQGRKAPSGLPIVIRSEFGSASQLNLMCRNSPRVYAIVFPSSL